MSPSTLTPVQPFEDARSHPNYTVYEITPKSDLPVINVHRSLGHVLFSHTKVQDQDLERTYYATMFISSYILGHIMAIIVCFIPRFYGNILACIGLCITLPSTFYSLYLLQYDVMKLLIQTYDFWFFTVTNTVGCVCLITILQDARACIAIILWFGNLHSSFVDANTRLISHLSIAAIVAAIFQLMILLSIQVFDFQDVVINENIRECVSSSLLTMVIYQLRNAYRRTMEVRTQRRIGCRMLRCINFRTWVMFHAIPAKRITSFESFKTIPPYYRKDDSLIVNGEMVMVTVGGLFKGNETFYPIRLHLLVWPHYWIDTFRFLRALSIGLIIYFFASFPSNYSTHLALGGLFCSVLHFGISILLYQRKLLRIIITSFDFLFLSLQYSAGLITAACLYQWDVRSIGLASIWIWLHWVMTIDAFTPYMRRRIGIRPQYLVPFGLLFLLSLILLGWDLMIRRKWSSQDIVLRVKWWNGSFSLTSFLMGRLVISFLWVCRVLYRIAKSNGNAAIMLLGRVAYSYLPSTQS